MSNLKECYKEMQEKCGIGVGDTVKVLRKAESLELGWGTDWDEYMNDMIGKQFVVDKVDEEYGFLLDGNNGYDYWWFPFFVLEIVKKKHEYDLSDLDTAIKLHKEMWDWLAEDPKNRNKYEWPGFKEYNLEDDSIHEYCFLCEYVNRKVGDCAPFDCKKNCPGKWGDYSLIHGEYGSLCQYGEFGFYENREGFSDLVLKRVFKQIRNICD